MIKPLSLLLLLLSAHAISVQASDKYEYIFGGIMRTGTMQHQGNLHRIVTLYNYTRPFMTEQMPFITRMNGWEAGVGMGGTTLGYTFGVSLMRAQGKASGIQPIDGLHVNRYITLSDVNLFFGIQWWALKTRFVEFGPGITFDTRFYGGYTTWEDNASKAIESDGFGSELLFGSTASAHLHIMPLRWFGIIIRPFYQFSFGQGYDRNTLMKTLQGSAFTYPINDKVRHTGIAVSAVIAFKRDP